MSQSIWRPPHTAPHFAGMQRWSRIPALTPWVVEVEFCLMMALGINVQLQHTLPYQGPSTEKWKIMDDNPPFTIQSMKEDDAGNWVFVVSKRKFVIHCWCWHDASANPQATIYLSLLISVWRGRMPYSGWAIMTCLFGNTECFIIFCGHFLL